MPYPKTGPFQRGLVIATVLGMLAGCGADQADAPTVSNRNTTQISLSGSVGDGPIVNADVVVRDARGTIVSTGVSDALANYTLDVPALTLFPLQVTATGGIDLVSGDPADFALVSAVTDVNASIVNISPFTTLVTRGASCRPGGLSPNSIAQMWELVHAELSMGFDPALMANPINDRLTADNASAVVYANEGLGEAIRRTHRALAASSAEADMDEIVERIACDVASGALDGAGEGVDVRTSGTFMAAAAGVQLEMLAHRLRVNGQDAMPALNLSLETILPEAQNLRVQDVPITAEFIEQASALVDVMAATLGTGPWDRYGALLTEADSANVTELVEAELSANDQLSLVASIDMVALGDDSLLSMQMQSSRDRRNEQAPLLSFSADPPSVDAGESALLSWASANATTCQGQNGDDSWSDSRSLDGTYTTAPLSEATEFVLRCSGAGGTTEQSLTVGIIGAGAPAHPPELAFTSDRNSVEFGGSATLSWESTGAESCAASGGWDGNPATAGTASVGPLSATTQFVLECQGAGGSITRQLSIQVGAAPSDPEPVDPPSDPPPPATVEFSASPMTVEPNATTTLNWTSTNADGCTAGGQGWSGEQAVSGTHISGPLRDDTTFGITCGTASSSLTVDVRVATLVTWIAPDETEGGEVLLPADLTGFTLHYGTTSGHYPHSIDVHDALARELDLSLEQGTWYFVMTASANGLTSGYSNEVHKVIDW